MEECACFAGSGVDFEASDIELEHISHVAKEVVGLFFRAEYLAQVIILKSVYYELGETVEEDVDQILTCLL